jgi:hypothetical protein
MITSADHCEQTSSGHSPELTIGRTLYPRPTAPTAHGPPPGAQSWRPHRTEPGNLDEMANHVSFAAVKALWQEATSRGLGDIQLKSNLTARRIEQTPYLAARNLLTKALLRVDDRKRAEQYVDRALQLPFDEHEGVHPAVHETHMLLYIAITDEIEDADESDSLWLDAALTTMDRCGPLARENLCEILHLVTGEYVLEPGERRKLRDALAGTKKTDVVLSRSGGDPAAQACAIIEVLEAIVAFERIIEDSRTPAAD